MHSFRRLARTLSLPLIALLLFSQLATAAYACPQGVAEEPVASHQAMSMDDCHGDMDRAQPNLCKSHHESFAQASSKTVTVDAPALVGNALPTMIVAAVPPRNATPWTLQVFRPPGGPPLYLVLSNLRN